MWMLVKRIRWSVSKEMGFCPGSFDKPAKWLGFLGGMSPRVASILADAPTVQDLPKTIPPISHFDKTIAVFIPGARLSEKSFSREPKIVTSGDCGSPLKTPPIHGTISKK
jgi:hypothetical protein